MAEAGRLKFVIEIDDKGSPVVKHINGEVQKLEQGTTGATTKMSKGFGAMWAQMALGQAAFAMVQTGFRMITQEIGSSIKMAIDAEETHSKFGTVFQQVAGKAAAASKELSDSWGVSKFASETMLSATGDLLTGLGLTGDAALDLSLQTQKLAIDLASFTNYSGGAAGASDALTKAMLGERESIKALGIVVTEEMVKEELMRVGKEKLTGMSLLQAKAEATLQIAMKQSANAMGDYARTQDSTANSIKRMQATWDDIKVAIGSAIVEVIGPALKNMKKWFEENKDAIVAGAKDIIKFMANIAEAVIDVIGWFWKHKDVVIALGIAYATYFAATKIMAMVSGFEALARAIMAGTLALGPMVIVVTAAAAAFLLLKNHMDKFKNVDKEMAASAANTTAFVERQAALEKLGVSYSVLDDALKDFKTSSNSMNEALDLAMESAKKGDPYLIKLAKAFEELEKQEKAAIVVTEDFKKVIPPLMVETDKLIKKEKTLIETMNERWAAFNINLIQDEAYSAFIESKLGPAIESHSDAWADNTDILKANEEMESRLGPAIVDTTFKVKKSAKTITESWQEVEAQFQAVERAIGYVDDMFSELGINVGGVTSQISKGLGAASMYSSGMASLNKEGGSLSDTLAGVTSIIGAVSAAITIAASIIKAFAGDGIGEAIKRENEWMQLNKELTKSLKELAKQMGDTHAATSVMLDDIIDEADITIANFATYAYRVNEILSDYDRNTLSLSQTQKEIGDSFTALISKAKSLGTEGSASILKLMDDLNSRGIRVKEIQDYINANWKAGLEGYKKYLEGDFSKATIGVFEYLLAYEKKVGANQALVDGIEGITQALIGMSNVIKLTEEEFDQFEMAGRDAYDKLIAQGFTSRESLMQLQPMLSRLIYLQKEYGLTIDAATQALIDKAKADGVDLSLVKSQDEIFGDMAGSLAELVDIFRNVFPQAIDQTTAAFKKLNEAADNFDPDTTYNPKRPDEEPAATGWQGWVAGGSNKRFITGETEPEYVSITPMSKMRGSDAAPGVGGSKIVSINITLAGTITPESAADAITTAYRNNTRGIRSLLEN
ncbi:MAG: hypothetical protein KKC03_14070 [Bacteroidetes bacterium]|nr:hypothetical protein [Bacteroidota bacterium]